MAKLNDLTGQRFGRLTVIERAANTSAGQARWHCKCDCGEATVVAGYHLRNGSVVSCGCHKNERSSQRAIARNTTHGKRNTRLYRIYTQMKTRCYNTNHRFYKRYGGRGIVICEEWLRDFQVFYDWAMANGYRDDLSIDRIDNDKGYGPENCRWASKDEQGRNKSNNRIIEIDGVQRPLSEWCEIHNVDYFKTHDRLRRGWTPEEALGLVPRNK